MLDGEGFFEISKNPSRPFLVYNKNVITRVLVTSFVVKNNPSGSETEVAVKTGKVYGLWHYFYASPFNILATEAVAKWSHPALFKDVNPEASLKELNQKFLSVPMTGTYFISLK